MSHQQPDPLDVDGSRPAVELVAALPRELTSQGERLVLLALACDSYDGQTSAPAAHNLAAWTGMHLSSVRGILRDLQQPTGRRPALLAVDVRSRGKRRTLYRLLLDGQPSGHAGRLESDEPSGHAGRLEQPQPSPNRRGTVGEPSGHAGRSTVGEPSGHADPSLSLTTPSPSPASPTTATAAPSPPAPEQQQEEEQQQQQGHDGPEQRAPHALPDDDQDDGLTAVVLEHLPRELGRELAADPRTLDTACRNLADAGWTLDDLEQVAARKRWHNAGPGAVIAWVRNLATSPRPQPARLTYRSNANRCPNGAPYASDGTCCPAHDSDAQEAAS
jgi:hypothetical protein